MSNTKPFGTEQDVYAEGYTYLKHSIMTRPVAEDPVSDMRITVGGPACMKPYSLSIFNISAMSFGALHVSPDLDLTSTLALPDPPKVKSVDPLPYVP